MLMWLSLASWTLRQAWSNYPCPVAEAQIPCGRHVRRWHENITSSCRACHHGRWLPRHSEPEDAEAPHCRQLWRGGTCSYATVCFGCPCSSPPNNALLMCPCCCVSFPFDVPDAVRNAFEMGDKIAKTRNFTEGMRPNISNAKNVIQPSLPHTTALFSFTKQPPLTPNACPSPSRKSHLIYSTYSWSRILRWLCCGSGAVLFISTIGTYSFSLSSRAQAKLRENLFMLDTWDSPKRPDIRFGPIFLHSPCYYIFSTYFKYLLTNSRLHSSIAGPVVSEPLQVHQTTDALRFGLPVWWDRSGGQEKPWWFDPAPGQDHEVEGNCSEKDLIKASRPSTRTLSHSSSTLSNCPAFLCSGSLSHWVLSKTMYMQYNTFSKSDY